jgi:hypothetical protein
MENCYLTVSKIYSLGFVTLCREFYKSTESALERAESMDGLGDLVGICLNRFYGDVSKEIREALFG